MSDTCIVCNKKVFNIDRVLADNKYPLHKHCFRCDQCKTPLLPTSGTVVNGKPYCKAHAPKGGASGGGSTTSARPAGKSYASGTGMDPAKINLNHINLFTIYSRDDSDKPLKVSEDKVVVKIDGPGPVDVVEVFDNGDASYDCEWEPKLPGTYKINVAIDGKPITNSPIILNLGGGDAGASSHGSTATEVAGQSSASGVGLDGSKITAGAVQLFTIHSKDASGKPVKVPESDVVVKITGPAPVDIVEVFDNEDATYDCEWQPPVVGTYHVDISIGGKKLKDSPYIVNMGGSAPVAAHHEPEETHPVASAPIASSAPSGKSIASGRGLDAAVIKPKEVTVFTVFAKNDDGSPAQVTESDIFVRVEGPGNPPADVFENEDGSFDVEWEPPSVSTYIITCKVKDKHVSGSPFTIDLAKGVTTKSSDAKPAETKPTPTPVAAAKKTAAPATTPAAAPKKTTTPVAAPVSTPAPTPAPAPTTTAAPAKSTAPAVSAPASDFAGKSTASGRGLDGTRLKPNDVAVFTIFPKDNNGNTIKVSDTQIEVTIDGPGSPIADIFDNPDSSWDVEWEPPLPGVYTVRVSIDGKPVNGSPFVVDLSGGAPPPQPLFVARGRGLDDTRLKIGQTGVFTIYPNVDITDNDISIKITGPGNPHAEIYHNGDNTYDVEWEPTQGGKFSIAVLVHGKPIKNSPFVLNIDPTKIWTPPTSQPKKPVTAPTPVTASTPAPTPATTTAPSSAPVSTSTGSFSEASGKGLTSSQCALNDINLFTIFPRDSSGKLIIVPEEEIHVSITGPGNAVTTDIFDNPDGSWDVEWSSPTPGEYTITVKVGNVPVKNSPFKVQLGSPVPESFSDATGLGLRGDRIKIGGDPALFTVYPRDRTGKIVKINENQLSVVIKGAATVTPDLFDNEDDSWDVEWSPPKPGEYIIDVKIDNVPIKGSPFVVKIP
eukprot:TRINITY_DN163_c0_g2_i1.p1 TRINITY_DN163_c0_g2~~TRINITY_DN163_c0_g2_i1.p1  ORF type:complete len:940 (-),score=239.07 TRINITY_DN163_c0_g2_i1:114-2933(-)